MENIIRKTLDTTSGRRFSEMGIRYHDVEPSDTMLSICSKYGITARELRQANFGLSGSNVQVGPKRLIIPATAGSSSDQAKSQPTPKQQRRQEHEENIGEADKDGESLHGRAKDNLQRSSIVKKIIDTTSDRRFSDMVRYHDVEPSETISSICSKYNITARELRQANFGLSGSNVQGGPKRLIIPAAAGRTTAQAKPQPIPQQKQERQEHEEKIDEADGDGESLQRTSIVKKVFDTTSGRRFSEMVRYHDVDQSDTMSSICLKYGITARELRQANFGLSGSNVQGGPKRLIIPAPDPKSLFAH